MEIQHAFEILAAVVEEYETGGGSVSAVETTTDASDGTLHARIDLPVPICSASRGRAEEGPRPNSATVTDDGNLAVAFAPSELPTLARPSVSGVSTTDRDVRVTRAGRIVHSVDVVIDPGSDDPQPADPRPGAAPGGPPRDEERSGGGPTDDPETVVEGGTTDDREGSEHGTAPPTGERPAPAGASRPGESLVGTARQGASEATEPAVPDEPGATTGASAVADARRASAPATVRDESLPAYEDVPYLERLYETCETFTEMSRQIDMDVSSETVRRYMIEAGVHEPTPYDTDADATGEATGGSVDDPTGPTDTGGLPRDEELIADGIGLPDELDVADVVDAVVDAQCNYEVSQALDLDGDRSRELLQRLDLIDLVSYRLTDAPEVEPTYEEVTARIRRCSPERA
jgi:hypothetical protein